jgi:hypothetical protein
MLKENLYFISLLTKRINNSILKLKKDRNNILFLSFLIQFYQFINNINTINNKYT